MRRYDRLEQIAHIIRDRPGITTATLADTIGVSPRSVSRDLATLRDRGLPLEADRGRGGGLRLRDSWGLGKVLLSREQALCTLLGLAISEKLGMPMFAQDLAAARRLIASAFPLHERKRIRPLRERIFVGDPASAAVQASYARPAAGAMRVLQASFVAEQRVIATYVRSDGTESERHLEPHALVINAPAWYLLGYDTGRSAVRTFRLDRFAAVSATTEPFRARPVELMRELLALGLPVGQV